MLAGMLPARLLRQQESGPAPPVQPVAGKTLVLSHHHASHARVARDLRETLASASPQPPPRGLGPSQHRFGGRGPDAKGTTPCMARGGFFANSHLPLTHLQCSAGEKDVAQALTVSEQSRGLLRAQPARFCPPRGASPSPESSHPCCNWRVTSTWVAPPNSPKVGRTTGNSCSERERIPPRAPAAENRQS